VRGINVHSHFAHGAEGKLIAAFLQLFIQLAELLEDGVSIIFADVIGSLPYVLGETQKSLGDAGSCDGNVRRILDGFEPCEDFGLRRLELYDVCPVEHLGAKHVSGLIDVHGADNEQVLRIGQPASTAIAVPIKHDEVILADGLHVAEEV